MRWRSLILLLFFAKNPAYGQKSFAIEGVIRNSVGTAVEHASVILKRTGSGKILAFSISQPNGYYAIEKSGIDSGHYILSVNHLSFLSVEKNIFIANPDQGSQQINFELIAAEKKLKEVVVKSAGPMAVVRNDTVEYNAKRYLTPEVRKVEDLLKKMQGFSVDPNGKITYNGKEVDKILIDGEDLADKAYKLISKNLNAEYVSKVQVVNNFNDDRLLREVENSGKIGINIQIDSQFQNRFSGGIDIASSFFKRKSGDNNNIFITRKIKFLALGTYNNIGINSGDGVGYYYESDEKGSAFNDPGRYDIIRASKIYSPSLPNAYINPNDDLNAALMVSTKIGKAIKLKALVNYNSIDIMTQGQASYFTTLFSGESWSIFNDAFSRNRTEKKIGKIKAQFDDGGNTTARLSVSMDLGQGGHVYETRSTGFFSDSLNERFRTKSHSFELNANITRKIKNKKVYYLELLVTQANLLNSFATTTSRFLEYFKLDSDYVFHNQQGDIRLNEVRLLQKLSIKGRSTLSEFGWQINSENYKVNSGISIEGKINTMPFMVTPDGTQSCYSRTSIYWLINKTLDRSNLLSGQVSVGAGRQQMESEKRWLAQSNAIYFGKVEWLHNFSSLHSLKFKYHLQQKLPGGEHFYPGGIISGSTTITSGATIIKPVREQVASMNYYLQDFHRQLGVHFLLLWSKIENDYINNTILQPQFTTEYLIPAKDYQNLQASAGLEKYVIGIKSKFSLQLSAVKTYSYSFINDILTKNNLLGLFSECTWASALSIPVNLQIVYKRNYSKNNISANGKTIEYDFWQHRLSGKMKASFLKKGYAALQYNWMKLSANSIFISLDAYLTYRLHKRLSFSVTGHNISKKRYVEQVNIGAGSFSSSRFVVIPFYVLAGVKWNY
jgi:hypothetical protein